MAIDRTNYNLLADDSGSNLDGTLWTKNQVKIVVLDPIDTLIGDWTTWTPTWSNVTLGNGTSTGRYQKHNKGVLYTAVLTLGTTSSITGGVGLNYPVTAVSASAVTGDVALRDASAGFFYRGMAFLTSGTAQTLLCDNSTAGGVLQGVTSTVPFTWATTDQIFVTGLFEAA